MIHTGGFLRHIQACNQHDPTAFRPLRFAGIPTAVGWIRPAVAAWLSAHDCRFRATAEGGVCLDVHAQAPADRPDANRPDSDQQDPAARSAALAAAAEALAAAGCIPPLRQELYPILTAWGQAPLAAIDRSAVALLGIPAYGLHVNGYTQHPQHGLSLWVAQRALDRAVAPGKLDNMIAGGQPLGLSLAENLRKEAWEEAGLSADWADRARPVGAVRYRMDLDAADGLRDDTLFLYDLELPPDLTPHNQDGEVAAFRLWPVAQVVRSIRDSDDWKFNCPLVVLDFLIRHQILRPETSESRTAAPADVGTVHEAEYAALCQGLRHPAYPGV